MTGIQLVHNLRAILPVWWCDDCGRFSRIRYVWRSPFRGRLVTELNCRDCAMTEMHRQFQLVQERMVVRTLHGLSGVPPNWSEPS